MQIYINVVSWVRLSQKHSYHLKMYAVYSSNAPPVIVDVVSTELRKLNDCLTCCVE